MIPTVRLYNPKGPDRVAVVSVQAAWGQSNAYILQVVRGPKKTKLANANVYGPYEESQLKEHAKGVIATLATEGFRPSGLHDALADLSSKNVAKSARAAERLGWLKDASAVDPLLTAYESAGDNRWSIVDALGRIGDTRALAVVRAEAEKKLLSRRRSGVEALRNLNDKVGLDAAIQRAIERLPENVRTELAKVDQAVVTQASVDSLVSVVQSVDVKDRGLVLDTLYEIGSSVCVQTVQSILAVGAVGQPHLWRYAKSILKRAMLRLDGKTFAVVAHALDAESKTSQGTHAVVKSGYDGNSKNTPIFRVPTQTYIRRLTWRFLRKIALRSPELYPAMAAEVLVAFGPEDDQAVASAAGKKHGKHNKQGVVSSGLLRSHLFHQVFYGSSGRFVKAKRSLVYTYKNTKSVQVPTNAREEAYAELWDQTPRAYLRVLAAARLDAVQQWAADAIAKRHQAVIGFASDEELIGLLGSTHALAVQLGLGELTKRFKPENPNWLLVKKMLNSTQTNVRDIGIDWAKQTVKLWGTDTDKIFEFLALGDAVVREQIAETAGKVLANAADAVRVACATKVIELLRQPEPTQGAFEGYARLARVALLSEVSAKLTTTELVNWISNGSASAKSVGAEVLSRRQGALQEVGFAQAVAMANNKIAAVRMAAQSMMRGGVAALQKEPSVLFTLSESEWPDTRKVAIELLRAHIDVAAMGIDGIIGLCDSNLVDVQDFGKELVLKHLEKLNPQEMIKRLCQHHHSNIQRFVLDLVVQHLKTGLGPLSSLEDYFRTVLMDLWPSRKTKRTLVGFLADRGQTDELQAEVAARILGEWVQSKTRCDFEMALEALTKIRIAFPTVASPVELQQGGAV